MPLNALGLRTGAFVLSFLVAGTMILTPPQVRPAAYNQLPPSLQTVVHAQRMQQEQSMRGGDNVLLDDDDAGDAADDSAVDLEGSNISSLMLFVVFHQRLHDDLYKDLRVPDAGEDVTHTSGENASTLLLNRGVTFVAANDGIEKSYNKENPLFSHRIVNEWEMPGYDKCIGSQMHEFGAMNSIFCSDWTLAGEHACHPGEGPSKRSEAAAHVLDTSFVGVLQYDMRIDTRTMQLLRKRIRGFRDRRIEKSWGGRSSRLVKRRHHDDDDSAVRVEASNRGGESGSHHGPSSKDHALKFSPKHQLLLRQAEIDAAVADHRSRLRCCVFYAVTHPTRYMLKGRVGNHLVHVYNEFYGTNKALKDAAPVGVLDGFVIPYSDFNSMMEFLRHVMGLLQAPAGSSDESGGSSAIDLPPERRSCAAHGLAVDQTMPPLDVLERAMALWLAFVDDIEFVAMPIKHQKL